MTDPLITADFLGFDPGPLVGGALIALGGSILLAVLRAAALVISGAQARRRELYSEAYKAAMAWREMLYRVRRRADGDEAGYALVDRFHELQEQIDYFEGWMASESAFMARSYCQLVGAVKDKTRDPIRAAWDEVQRRQPGEGEREGDTRPDLGPERARFLQDVRRHLSLLFLPKIAVWWRHREKETP